MISALASRMMGSPDIYHHSGRTAQHSINFITCHDGFTLADLVAYNDKHNKANGEDGRDGTNDNNSWNCGIEGILGNTDNDSKLDNDLQKIQNLRDRQVKNFCGHTFVVQGSANDPLQAMKQEKLNTVTTILIVRIMNQTGLTGTCLKKM